MKKTLFLIILLLVAAGNIYAKMSPAPKYNLSTEEKAQVRQLLDGEGYVHEIESIEAYNHGSEIKIAINSKPIIKERYQQIDTLVVDYRDGKMKISDISRKIKHELTDYYFYVDRDISDWVINRALEKYHSGIKNKSFSSKKAGELIALSRFDNAYMLTVAIAGDYYYLLRVFLDTLDATRIIRTEIDSRPLI